MQWQGARNVGGGQPRLGGTNFTAPRRRRNILGARIRPTTLGTDSTSPHQGLVTIPAQGGSSSQPALPAAEASARVHCNPNVLTLDNEEAKIIIKQNVPFITRSYTPSSTSPANPFQTIERKDIGITLRVTPQVSEAGAVKLKIFQEVSSVTRDKALVQSADIITNKRSLESTVLVDDGQIVVLGGLIQDDQQAALDKVPFLGDLPIIGSLFKYETRNRKRTNLMVFLRPVVLKDEKSAASLTADRYEYIRGLQGEMKLPWNGRLPPVEASKLTPLDETRTRPLGETGK